MLGCLGTHMATQTPKKHSKMQNTYVVFWRSILESFSSRSGQITVGKYICLDPEDDFNIKAEKIDKMQ